MIVVLYYEDVDVLKDGNGETPEQTKEKSDHFVGRYYAMSEKENQEKKKINQHH